MQVSEIDPPALVVDLDIMERNLQRVACYARDNGLRLRPHTKTHKSVLLGKCQLAGGAAGLTRPQTPPAHPAPKSPRPKSCWAPSRPISSSPTRSSARPSLRASPNSRDARV